MSTITSSNRLTFFLFATVLMLLPGAYAESKVGKVILNENPADPEPRKKWHPEVAGATWGQFVSAGANGEEVLQITASEDNKEGGDTSVEKDVQGKDITLRAGRFQHTRSLSLSQLRGWRVDLKARIKTVGVPKPDFPWEGVRLGIDFRTPLHTYGSSAMAINGDRDWFDVTVRNVRIPADAKEAHLFAGLIANSGTVLIERIQIELVEPPLTEIAKTRAPFVQKTRLRGMGIAEAVSGIPELAEALGMNVVKRWIALPSPDLPETEYRLQLDEILSGVDLVLNAARAKGIMVILQVSIQSRSHWLIKSEDGTPQLGGTERVYLEPEVMERFIESWKIIAERYSGVPEIEGFDLLNETVLRVPPAEGCLDWEGLAERTAQMINKIDPQRRIYIQPEQWWGVRAFTRLRPIKADNLIYSIHMYDPFEVTHQGITERQSLGFTYPGEINGNLWDKEALRKALQPARDFQMAYGVPMQVGELGCIRWAPNGSSARWFRDMLEIFEEYGWDYTYHAELDFDGWSVLLGEDPANHTAPKEPTAEHEVIKEFFSRNN